MADRVSSPLPAALEDRVGAVGGAPGAVLRPVGLTLGDVAGHEGHRGVPGAAGPNAVRAYSEARADADGTNPSAANLSNTADPVFGDRILGPSGADGAPAGPRGTEPHAGPPRPDLGGQVKPLVAGGVIRKSPSSVARAGRGRSGRADDRRDGPGSATRLGEPRRRRNHP